MKHRFNTFGVICIVLVHLSCFYSSSIAQMQTPQLSGSEKSQLHKPDPQIFNPSNWIARGGCWDFSRKIFFSQGYRGGNAAYYKKQDYRNFTYEVKVIKLAEDGPLGIIFRYDEARDEGYSFAVYPHGEYFLVKFSGHSDVQLIRGATAYLNEEMNTWNTLKIVARGAKFDCYINGNFLVSVIDHSYSVGKIGLANSGDPRQLAKFEVISLIEH